MYNAGMRGKKGTAFLGGTRAASFWRWPGTLRPGDCTALTAHLVMRTDSCEPRFLGEVGKALHDKFKIEHSTLQVEPPEAPDPCRQASEGTL